MYGLCLTTSAHADVTSIAISITAPKLANKMPANNICPTSIIVFCATNIRFSILDTLYPDRLTTCPKIIAAAPDIKRPPIVAKKAMPLFLVQPLSKYIETPNTMADVIMAAIIDHMPRKIIGENRNTKQIKVNNKETADLTPFFPPTMHNSIKNTTIYK